MVAKNDFIELIMFIFIIFMMFIPGLLFTSFEYYEYNVDEQQETDGTNSRKSDQSFGSTLENNHATRIEDVLFVKKHGELLDPEITEPGETKDLDKIVPKAIDDDMQVYFYEDEEIKSTNYSNNVNDTLPKKNPYHTKWYTQGQIPCWDLPIIYAEELNRTIKTEVFSIYGNKLRNIIHKEISRGREKSIRLELFHKREDNGWCSDLPCFADHTLCYFDTHKNSRFCNHDFVVEVPGVADQMAIVNTINSMRNHVANGISTTYSHLPTAADMKQILYHYDLQKMSKVWLRQCLPGPAPCSSLNGMLVSELRCTRHADQCCLDKGYHNSHCSPLRECFIPPIIGCLHAWFESAGNKLTSNHVAWGHITHSTYSTVQLLWAKTSLIGCATGIYPNGNIRVICNFSPGLPYTLKTKYFCGLTPHTDITDQFNTSEDITSFSYVRGFGISMKSREPDDINTEATINSQFYSNEQFLSDSSLLPVAWGAESLIRLYEPGWATGMQKLQDFSNRTLGFSAKLVTQYDFILNNDDNEPIYIEGLPGSQCTETGWVFKALCYGFRDPTPGYRLVAVVAPVALLTLILYDLFSSVVRQTVHL